MNYYGWTNFATWAVFASLTQHHEACLAHHAEQVRAAAVEPGLTPDQSAQYALADRLRADFPVPLDGVDWEMVAGNALLELDSRRFARR